MSDTVKNIFKKILATLIGILLFYLLGRYARIQTGIVLSYIMLQYPLLCIISILYGPVVGLLTGLAGHILMDYASSHYIWLSWPISSGLLGLTLGLLSHRFHVFKREIDLKDESRIWLRLRYALIIMGISFLVFAGIAPLLAILLDHYTLMDAFKQGIFVGIANGLTSAILTDLFFTSFRHTILRRIIAVLTLINSLVLISYGSASIGSIILYLITLLLGLYLFFYKRWNTKSPYKVVTILKRGLIVVVVFFALVITFIASFAALNRPTGKEKIAIVLGAGLDGEEPTRILKLRLDQAYDWYMEEEGRILVTSGGQGRDEVISEGEAMKKYLIKRGIPEEDIFAETASTTTQENFRYSLALLKSYGYRGDTPVIFVTNNFHCFRALQYAKSEGFTQIKSLAASTPVFSILPNYSRECIAIIKYCLIMLFSR